MLFSSLIFLFVFLPIVLIVNFILKGSARNYFLLAASLIFYAWGEPRFVLVMIASIIVNYLFGVLIANAKFPKQSGDASPTTGDVKRAKLYLILDIIVNLGILFIFKYLNFAISNIDRIFGDILPQTAIALPIGISFFTFQAMSYVIDVYRGNVEAQRNPFYLGLYISLFPQLIAGPIVRYSDIESQIVNRTVTADSFGEGVRRFLIGFNKKILIANNMAIVADWAFNCVSDGSLSASAAWLGALCYTLQIYFDFGGYSDMAIGLGRMLGFTYMENFNYPYLSKSATEFWRRWHISLGSWFRDYVYIPLGGSRVSAGRHIFNLFVVWALTGMWHGANWTFIVWGLLYFVLLVFEKKTGFVKDSDSKFVNAFKHVYALFFVVLGWVIFRSDSLALAGAYIKTMFGFGGVTSSSEVIFYLHEYWVFIVVAIIYSTSAFAKLRNRILRMSSQRDGSGENLLTICGNLVYILLFLVSVSYLVIGSYNPFIYFNF